MTPPSTQLLAGQCYQRGQGLRWIPARTGFVQPCSVVSGHRAFFDPKNLTQVSKSRNKVDWSKFVISTDIVCSHCTNSYPKDGTLLLFLSTYLYRNFI